MKTKLNDDNTGVISLGSSHSLILGHKPDVLDHKRICDKLASERKSMMNFGLFDTASPNYSTYYPDLDVADLTPKDEDFIYPVFRALSMAIVSKGFPIDFSAEGILKASMNKLIGQSINIDHETAVGNAVGSVKEVFWQDSYKTSDGITVPAGINMVMMIDGKSNPRIARGIMMDPPSIHSNSVSIRFKWEPSHQFEEKWEFYEKVGTYDKDGTLVRAVVTEIMSYSETSLVAHGADVFAQKVGSDGKIINPGYSNSVYEFSDEDKNDVNATVHIDYKNTDTKEQSFSGMFSMNSAIPTDLNTSSSNKNNNKNVTPMKKEDLEKLTSKFNFAEGELTEDNYIAKISEKLSEKETEITNLTQKYDDLKAGLLSDEEFKTMKADAEVGKTALTDTRAEALRLYNLAKGDKADATIVNLINASTIDQAKSLLTQYKDEAETKFSATCSCGKTIKLSSGIGSEENLIDEDGNPIEKPAGTSGPSDAKSTLQKFRAKRNESLIFKGKKQ